jgi:hypothetical protein
MPGSETTPVTTRIDHGHQRAAERLTRYWSRGDLSGRAKHQLSFDACTVVEEIRRQSVET